MKTLWPAATLAIAITGYFAWSNYSAPSATPATLDDCHRLAGEASQIHDTGGTIPSTLLGAARGCTVAFGQDWGAQGGERAVQLRAEGAMRVQ
ncbi:hypothetical protein [Devosia sp. CAU 1758]